MYNYTHLAFAAQQGRTDVVKALISTPGIDVNKIGSKQGRTALGWAIEEGHMETAKVLLTAPGIDVNKKFTLHDAAWECRAEIVKLMIKTPGVDANLAGYGGNTPLHEAARNHWQKNANIIATVKALLEAPGIDVNIKNNEGKTALMIAEEKGRKDVAELLKAAGAK